LTVVVYHLVGLYRLILDYVTFISDIIIRHLREADDSDDQSNSDDQIHKGPLYSVPKWSVKCQI